MFTYRKLRLPGESQPYMYVRAGISISSILERTQKDFLLGMGPITAAAILILLSSILLSKRYILDKVAALREVTDRISRGDLSARAPEIVSGGELGELGSSFDNMASRLLKADTERQEAVKELRESEERFRRLFESSRDALMTLEPPSWAFTSGNQATVEMFRARNVEDLTNYAPGDLSPERQPDGRASAQKAKEMIEKAMREGSHLFEWTHKRINGEEFPAIVLLTRVEIAGKQFLQATARDITERKRAEEHLARLHQQNELILCSAAEGILGLDLQGRHTFVNPAAARMLGYEVEELLGRPSHSTWHHTKPDGSPYPIEECRILASYRDGAVHHVSAEVFWSKDGTSFPVEYSSTPIFEQGRLAGAVLTFADITERKRSEEALQESDARYRGLFEHMLEGIAYCKMIFENGDPVDFIFLSVNAAFETLTGLKDVVGKKVSEVIPGIRATDPSLFEAYGRVASTGNHENIENFVEALQQWFSISIYSPEQGHFI